MAVLMVNPYTGRDYYQLIDGTRIPHVRGIREPSIMHKGTIYWIEYFASGPSGSSASVRSMFANGDKSDAALFYTVDPSDKHYSAGPTTCYMVPCGNGYIGVTSSVFAGCTRVVYVDIDREIIELREHITISRISANLYPAWDSAQQRLHVFYYDDVINDILHGLKLVDCLNPGFEVHVAPMWNDSPFIHVYDGFMYICYNMGRRKYDIATGDYISNEFQPQMIFSADGPLIMSSIYVLDDKTVEWYIDDIRTGDHYNVSNTPVEYEDRHFRVASRLPCSALSLPSFCACLTQIEVECIISVHSAIHG